MVKTNHSKPSQQATATPYIYFSLMTSTRVPLIFGTMTFGEAGKMGVRTSDLAECQKVLDVYFAHGGRELDTARLYGQMTTEACLSKLNLHGATVDTKIWPFAPGDHSPAKLRGFFQQSVDALGGHIKPRVYYLHAPDRSVDFAETLEEINRMHQEGLFEIFGLSNFASWEVAEVVTICKAKGWVVPKIYQAPYNAIARLIEPELVPCLRKYNIRLVVYSPLAGGFFAGHLTSVTDAPSEGRFETDTVQGKMFRQRYLNNTYLDALADVKAVAEKHQLGLTEIALRWLQHHSALESEDGVILGASSAEQLEKNCVDSEKGPLPAEVVTALDNAWLKIGIQAPSYIGQPGLVKQDKDGKVQMTTN
ncbi:hypothetical protein BOTBODRAFT_32757 [Botryobasidium botryosum FD-172 SS1]|uniref:NADP-dependent oxidoreductase domain-containing protein n=1 Tax=Botryobasidium botryosum (strain FD-172 SS1) TaxID=930990 RepID=A0A067MR01_BOTB1|nr:hypothetical protein BOTBODRAFT_32757 [Botryobasidium botryosum FD-172 SS1]